MFFCRGGYCQYINLYFVRVGFKKKNIICSINILKILAWLSKITTNNKQINMSFSD